MQRTVAVTGASGFVGRELVKQLLARGYGVIALGRRPETAAEPGVEPRAFDPNAAPSAEAFRGADAVVHLAGESVAGRWTPEKKRRIAASRIDGTRTLVASLRALERRPSVLVCASAVGYYGDRGDEPLTESSAPGSDFLARTCVEWEAAARECEALGIRCVRIRTGIALGNGGALTQMLTPFKIGAGGPLGSGRQFVPWIHVRDLAALYCFALENASRLTGPVNGVAPDYATNARLAQAIGTALRRPSLAPAPAFALRGVLGEFAGSLLASQLVLPAVAQDAGFAWQHAHLEAAVAQILHAKAGVPRIRSFAASQIVARPLEEVFAFFSEARNLEAITPARLSFAIRCAPQRMGRGSVIEYDLRVRGLPVHWKTLITEFEPPRHFADVQLRGPYRLWRHVHEFAPVNGGVEIVNRVEYLLPFAPLGEIAAPLVRRDVEEIFRFRREAIAQRFKTT